VFFVSCDIFVYLLYECNIGLTNKLGKVPYSRKFCINFSLNIGCNQAMIHAKMSSIKDRNGMDLTEAEDIKKRWQQYTELYKKDLHDPDNHDGVITHLEPNILECEVKWALGSIIMNKASGGDRIPIELFQILKDDAGKCHTQYVSKFGKLSSGHRTGKGQFLFQSQRKAMPKNAQTTTQLHSSPMLVK